MESSPEDLTELERQLSRPDTRWPRVEYGPSVMVVAVGVLVLLGAIALPWSSGGPGGWTVLLGEGHIGALPRLFTITALLFGVVVSTLALPSMILAETALSFLGLGLRPPMTSWGVLLQETQNLQSLVLYPWVMSPAIVIVVVILAFSFLGDGLRDASDPYTI